MDYYRAKWWDVEGQFHTNFFVNIYDTRFSSYDVSYVTLTNFEAFFLISL